MSISTIQPWNTLQCIYKSHIYYTYRRPTRRKGRKEEFTAEFNESSTKGYHRGGKTYP